MMHGWWHFDCRLSSLTMAKSDRQAATQGEIRSEPLALLLVIRDSFQFAQQLGEFTDFYRMFIPKMFEQLQEIFVCSHVHGCRYYFECVGETRVKAKWLNSQSKFPIWTRKMPVFV